MKEGDIVVIGPNISIGEGPIGFIGTIEHYSGSNFWKLTPCSHTSHIYGGSLVKLPKLPMQLQYIGGLNKLRLNSWGLFLRNNGVKDYYATKLSRPVFHTKQLCKLLSL